MTLNIISPPQPTAKKTVARPKAHRAGRRAPHSRDAGKDVTYDPGRRLIAAIVAQAAQDYLYPRQDLDPEVHVEAGAFLKTGDGRHFLNQLGISHRHIRLILDIED